MKLSNKSFTSKIKSSLSPFTVAVEVPKDIHIDSRTYAGKNTADQIAKDATDLCGAICRDTDKLRNSLTNKGYDSKLIDDTIKTIIDKNKQNGIF